MKLRDVLPPAVRFRLGSLRERVIVRWHVAKAQRRLAQPRPGSPHGLPGKLVVSLTSYPARFATLHLTLACLLDQSVQPDRIVLWIAHDDFERLPDTVRVLEKRGPEIRGCDDLRSYKKLIPALEQFPEAFIATADDDLYYPPNWIEDLVQGALATSGVITCKRAHRIKIQADGRLAPYLDWDFDVQDSHAHQPSADILPTGSGGILYPPKSLDPRVTDRASFRRLCPDGDDLWFYWCARLRGTFYKKVGRKMRLIAWPGSQESSLWGENEAGRNDRMIARLEGEFGLPNMS